MINKTKKITEHKMLDTQYASSRRETLETVILQLESISHKHIFKSIIDNMPHMFMILNDCRQIVFANARVTDVLKCEFTNIQGLRPGEAFGCANADKFSGGCGTSLFCKYCDAVKSIVNATNNITSIEECRVTTAQGMALNLRVWAFPLPVIDKRFVAFICDDISDEKRRQSLERIFFHDVLNTVGGVKGAALMLKDTAKNSSPPTGISDKLINLTDRLIDEIKAQKEIFAAETNQLEPQHDAVNSGKIIQNIIDLYKNHSAGQGVKIKVLSGSSDFNFKSDAILLERVIGNMLKNALEATPCGQSVQIGCRQQGSKIFFEVHNPAYIPEDIQRQIFQRSFSTKGEGRGLGTYSMKILSNRYLKGDIFFTSTNGMGTVFTASYPYIPVDPPATTDDNMPTDESAPKTGKVLIVDDIDINREIIEYILTDEGFTTRNASNGREALQMLKNEKFDLVFMDISMPELSGTEASEIIRQTNKDMPIIAMTANASSEDMKIYESAGMNDCISKPFDTEQILKKTRQWIH
jgi:CheY-like chemotaxis protein/nitrogen-specific signal transduction histidine kinase